MPMRAAAAARRAPSAPFGLLAVFAEAFCNAGALRARGRWRLLRRSRHRSGGSTGPIWQFGNRGADSQACGVGPIVFRLAVQDGWVGKSQPDGAGGGMRVGGGLGSFSVVVTQRSAGSRFVALITSPAAA